MSDQQAPQTNSLTPEQMRALIAADRQQRQQQAVDEFNAFCTALCQRHRVMMSVEPYIQDGRILATINIIAE
jgi:hypothetical protein